jgi:hypothetical protein
MSNQYDDQMDESQVPDESASGAEEYNQEGGGVSERRVSAKPVPSFSYYVLAPRGATLGFEFDDKARPVARHRFEIVEGPTGTVGLPVFADQRLYARREKWTPNKDANGRAIMEPFTSEEQADEFRKYDNTQGRVQQAFGIEVRNPKGKTAVQLGAYIAQFDPDHSPAPQNIIAEVKRQTKNNFTKNVIWFDSIAGLDEKPLEGKFKTALDEARAMIKAENAAIEKAAKKAGGGGGRTSSARTTQAASAPALD